MRRFDSRQAADVPLVPPGMCLASHRRVTLRPGNWKRPGAAPGMLCMVFSWTTLPEVAFRSVRRPVGQVLMKLTVANGRSGDPRSR